MSLSRAKNLLRGVRFHHLGFCFFWAVSFVVLAGLQRDDTLPENWMLYAFIEQFATFALVGSIAFFYRKKRSVLPPRLALVAGFALGGGALLYFLSFILGYHDMFGIVSAGLLVGFANALFFVLWQTFFVTEGQQRAIIYIPLSAVFSILLYFLVMLLPEPLLIFATVIVLPFLAMFTLYASLNEVELYPIQVADKVRARKIVGDLWKPVFCVCAIGFVWKLVSHFPMSESSEFALGGIAVLIGFGAAGLFVVFLELFSPRGFDILRVYQILFPLITGIFLLPTFFGAQYTSLLSGMLMFGFEVVNLLLLIICAVYAAQKKLSPLVMYGICIFPTLVFMSIGDILGSFLNPMFVYDFAFAVNVLFVCIYLLSMVLVLVSRGKRSQEPIVHTSEDIVAPSSHKAKKPLFGVVAERGKAEEGSNESSAAVSRGDDECPIACFQERGVSPREIEVAQLLLKGNSVAAISRKLFISENTTRGHTKSIYKKMNVHSRQELIDAVEKNE